MQAAEAGGFDFVVTPLRSGGDIADLLSGSQAPGQALSAADALYVEGEHASQVRRKPTTFMNHMHFEGQHALTSLKQRAHAVSTDVGGTARQHGCQHSLSSFYRISARARSGAGDAMHTGALRRWWDKSVPGSAPTHLMLTYGGTARQSCCASWTGQHTSLCRLWWFLCLMAASPTMPERCCR